MAPKEEAPRSRLQQWFPNAKRPIIMSAPMLGVSNGSLAAQVSKAGGFGFIPGAFDFTPESAQLAKLESELATARTVLGVADLTLTPAPVGVGFVTGHPSVSQFKETTLPILEKYMPQAVWLFAPDPAAQPRAHADLIPLLQKRGFKVFVQVGTVAAAREAVQDGADAIVAQGIDAGGHQWASGAGVISLVPEVREMLDAEFPSRDVALVASGGIADARGVVAVLALGAEAAAMGTRFVTSRESSLPEHQKKLIVETRDGGASTVKSTFHDDIRGINVWPELYDGRAIIGDSFKDHVSGVSLEDNRAKLDAAKSTSDNSRVVTWAGTGVGLIKDELPAGDIVRNLQEKARQSLAQLHLGVDDWEEKKEKSWIKELGQTLYKHK